VLNGEKMFLFVQESEIIHTLLGGNCYSACNYYQTKGGYVK
jgi:hypothetical protein